MAPVPKVSYVLIMRNYIMSQEKFVKVFMKWKFIIAIFCRHNSFFYISEWWSRTTQQKIILHWVKTKMISQKTYTGVKCSYSLVNSSSYNFHSLCKDIRGGGFHYIRLTQCGKILPTSSLGDVSLSPNLLFLCYIIFHGNCNLSLHTQNKF